jgi:thiamine-phosphate pyrophosphorylase
MRLIVVSPDSEDPREIPALGEMLREGLERYHVRKPSWSEARLRSWIQGVPEEWRPRLSIHGHAGIASDLGLGGSHERERDAATGAKSRSVHSLPDLARLRSRYAYLFYGPVFASLSKPGYGPSAGKSEAELGRELSRGAGGGLVYAIGGVTAERLARVRDIGFDGAAVLGAVWGEEDPVGSFRQLREAAGLAEAAHHGS